MGCLLAKPTKEIELEPEVKDVSKPIDPQSERRITDIFTSSTSQTNRLPPMVLTSNPKKKSKKGRKRARVSDFDDREMQFQIGMIKFQDRQGYVAVFDTRVLQKYYVKGLIGQGKCSDIFRAEHKSTKQPFAIKAIDKLRAFESCDVELAVLRRVSHPNILQLVEVIDCPDRVFFIIELATGGDLLDRMSERGHFSENEACHIVKNLLDGLSYLHSLAIAHCDLRPENILLYHPGSTARPIITDFGQAVECRDLDGVVLTAPLQTASPEYLAPEILARFPAHLAVDMWSIGVLAFTMLSGQLPFTDNMRPVLLRKILRAQYSFNERHWHAVSTQAKNFIDRLLVVDASNRMSANQAMRHAWIFATLGPGVEHAVKSNGHIYSGGAKVKGDRPESAGMFSLGDVSIHSLRLKGSSSTKPSRVTSDGRPTISSAGGSSIRSHDNDEVESTIDLSTVIGAETDDNESSITDVVAMRTKFRSKSPSSFISE